MKIVYCLVQELLTQNFLVTLKTEDNAKLSILLNEGFKRSVSWNKYKIILKDYNNEYIKQRLDASFQGINRLFARGVTNEDWCRKFFLPRLKINSGNIKTDVRKFYDRSINDLIKQYGEAEK